MKNGDLREAMNPNRVILEMIGQLHDRGFQGIRLSHQLSNSGVHWIAWLTTAENVLPSHGAVLHPHAMMQAIKSAPNKAFAAHYNSAQGTKYFRWEDAEDNSSAQLADEFAEHFSWICKNGCYADSEYAKWFKGMLVALEPDGLPSTRAGSPETNTVEKDRLVVIEDLREVESAFPNRFHPS